MGTRQLDLQWVTGDADVAETSFFKINTQGTPLDKTEEELLRNRNRPPAIAARSIVRAAKGHKYWSKFNESTRSRIESLAEEANLILFQPELSKPIKNLQLPLGGSSSTLDDLSLLIRFIAITDGTLSQRRLPMSSYENDDDGCSTVEALINTIKVLRRFSGNTGESLGFHPAVYFYSDRGKYLPDLFLGLCYLIKGKMINNDSAFFKAFTERREAIEKFLVDNKALILQLLQQINSRVRVERVAEIFDYLVKEPDGKMSIDGVEKVARLKGSIVNLHEKVEGKTFNDASKSAIVIRQSLETAMRCPICKSSMEPSMSVSFDHISRKEDGGTGETENGQLTHPYCNTGFKN